jgi:hypothetical protein
MIALKLKTREACDSSQHLFRKLLVWDTLGWTEGNYFGHVNSPARILAIDGWIIKGYNVRSEVLPYGRLRFVRR